MPSVFKVISDMHGFRVYRGSRKGGWEKNIPYQEELKVAYYVAENWRLVQHQAVSRSTIFILNDQAVYVVTKLPL